MKIQNLKTKRQVNYSHEELVQKSYLMMCLQYFKPEFQFKRIVEETLSFDKVIFCNVIVYDMKEQKDKMLVVLKSSVNKSFQQFQNLLADSFRTDIVLSLLDQYFLDANQHFYIFELESCDMTLQEFINLYQVNIDIFQPLIYQIEEHIKNCFGLYFQGYLKDYSQYYVNLISSNKLEVKLNLVSTQILIDNFNSQQIEQEQQFNSKNKISDNDNFQNKNNQNEMEFEENIFKDLTNSVKLKKIIKELCEQVNCKIENKGLSDLIQNKFSSVLKFHPLEIFSIIQQHPIYDRFEVKKLQRNHFQLNVEKRGQTIRLIADKFDQLNKAEQILSKYRQLIENNKNLHSNIQQSELITTESGFYILTEKNEIEDGEKNLYRTYMYIPLELIEFCKNLIYQNGILINNIDPQSILIKRNDDQQEQNIQYFVIDNITSNDYSSEYCYIFEQLLMSNYQSLGIRSQIQVWSNLVKLFFQKINEKSLLDINNLYNDLSYLIQNLEILKSSHLKIKISKKHTNQISVNFSNSCGGFQEILEMQKKITFFKITYLKLEDTTFNFNVSDKLKDISEQDQQSYFIYQQKQRTVNELNNFFSTYKSDIIRQYSNKLNEFLLNKTGELKIKVETKNYSQGFIDQNSQINNNENLIVQQGQMSNQNNQECLLTNLFQLSANNQTNNIDSTNQDFNITQIINLNELSQNEFNLISSCQFNILNIHLNTLAIKLLIFDQNIYYLIGGEPYFIFNYDEFQNIKQIFELQEDFIQGLKIFGSNYINLYKQNRKISSTVRFMQEFNHLQILSLAINSYDVQFDLSGCKQILQLNLAIMFPWGYHSSAKSFNFNNIFKQIDSTNAIKLKFISIYNQNKGQINLTKIYKIKRLVTVSFAEKIGNYEGDSNGSIKSYKVDYELENLLYGFDDSIDSIKQKKQQISELDDSSDSKEYDE
ncbi:hypothetical protein ABPG74_020869 [Tetrahymena malaccensis]